MPSRQFIEPAPSCKLVFNAWEATMTVKIDGVEPNVFPDVEDLDARDAGRNVEVFLSDTPRELSMIGLGPA